MPSCLAHTARAEGRASRNGETKYRPPGLGPQNYRRHPRAGAVDVLNLASDGLCDPRVALHL